MIDYSKIQINAKWLYYFGSYALGVMVIGGIISLSLTWPGLNIGSRMFTIAGICFNALFAWFFVSLYLKECKPTPAVIQNADLDNMLKQLNSKKEGEYVEVRRNKKKDVRSKKAMVQK